MKKKGNVFALWLCLAILVITAFASISFAQQSSPSSFETFVDDTYKQIQDSSKPFIDASDIAFGTPGAAATSVFSAFNPGYCGEDIYTLSAGWIGLTVLALFVVGLGITLLWMI